jgi:hypothetical protein
MIAHQLRHRPVGDAHRAGGAEEIEQVVGDLCFQRPIGILAPVRQQLVETDRIEDHARQDVGADLRALLDDDHAALGRQLFEADRRREPGGPGADDHHVIFHRLARRQSGFVGHVGLFLSVPLH